MTLAGLLTVYLFTGAFSNADDENWVELFDGKTLDGWSVHSGYATYHVEDGMIVGTAVKNSPNTFLCTDKEYADFILEFEVLLDPELNSGVQFRSQIGKEETVFWFQNKEGQPQKSMNKKDRVYGYQVEIATEERGTSGGVYDEARRAFMMQVPEPGSEASQAFKDGQWNKYRLECNGSAIKTWVNGELCTDFQDSMTAKGIFGLQVHDVGDNPTPYKVRWKNLRIKLL